MPAETTYGFGFLDETGTLGGPRDPYFGVGLLRTARPFVLARAMQRERDREHFYDEIKWNKVSGKKLPLLRTLVDLFIDSDATFSAFIANKAEHDVIGRFGGPFRAYEALARQLVRGSARRGETLWIIADEYSTPPEEAFEENVRDWVNTKCRRPAVAGVLRLRSTGSDLLQLVDILLGAVVYEHKAEQGLVPLTEGKPKVDLLAYIKERATVSTFLGGFRDARFNVAHYHERA